MPSNPRFGAQSSRTGPSFETVSSKKKAGKKSSKGKNR